MTVYLRTYAADANALKAHLDARPTYPERPEDPPLPSGDHYDKAKWDSIKAAVNSNTVAHREARETYYAEQEAWTNALALRTANLKDRACFRAAAAHFIYNLLVLCIVVSLLLGMF